MCTFSCVLVCLFVCFNLGGRERERDNRERPHLLVYIANVLHDWGLAVLKLGTKTLGKKRRKGRIQKLHFPEGQLSVNIKDQRGSRQRLAQEQHPQNASPPSPEMCPEAG